MKAIAYWVSWSWLLLATFILSLGLSWALLAQADFLYGLLYEPVGIDAAIARYGPENTLRPGFQATTRQERERLFGALVEQVHGGAEGLEALHYHGPDGVALGPLLTRSEIRHLRDVAELVDRGRRLLWIIAALWVLQVGYLLIARIPFPRPRHLAILACALLGVIALSVLVPGPEAVFYQFHRWLFPAEHQWFFYYRESLMSMMMRAPDLFGWIAMLLAATALPFGFLLLGGLRLLSAMRG